MLKKENRLEGGMREPACGVREYTAVREIFGELLTAKLTCFPQGIQASLYGGSSPHIGAVSIVSPEGEVTTTEFPGHRDGTISEKWAAAFAASGHRPAVVVVGIHYDHVSKAQIGRIVETADEMLAEFIPDQECAQLK